MKKLILLVILISLSLPSQALTPKEKDILNKKIANVCTDSGDINPHYTNACANLLQAKALDEQNEILKHFYNGTYVSRK